MKFVSRKIFFSIMVSLGLLAGSSSDAVAGMDAPGCLQSYYMKSYAKALPLCQLAAQAGHEQSQFILGMMYAEGNGTPRSYQNAIRWLEAASRQGHLAARYKIQNLERELSDAARRDMTSSFWLPQKAMPVEKDKETTVKKAEPTAQAAVKKRPLQIETFAEPKSIKRSEQNVVDPKREDAELLDIQPLDVEPEFIQPADIKIIETAPAQAQERFPEQVSERTVPVTVQENRGEEPMKEDFSKSWPQYEGLNRSETSEIAETMARDLAEPDKK